MIRPSKASGFTLIEIVLTLFILAILAAFALPKFTNITRQARIATLENIVGNMRSTISLVKARAYAGGFSKATSDPIDQSAYLIQTDIGTTEIDWRNFCPESIAEFGDSLNMADLISMTDEQNDQLSVRTSNQYTWIGYDIRGFGPATVGGCYITYDSFGNPDCTIDLITTDC